MTMLSKSKRKKKPQHFQELDQDYCTGFYDAFGKWNTGFPCPKVKGGAEQHCCGSETYKTCCSSSGYSGDLPRNQDKNQDSKGDATGAEQFNRLPLIIAIAVTGVLLVVVVVLIICFYCQCCALYRKRNSARRSGPARGQSLTGRYSRGADGGEGHEDGVMTPNGGSPSPQRPSCSYANNVYTFHQMPATHSITEDVLTSVLEAPPPYPGGPDVIASLENNSRRR